MGNFEEMYYKFVDEYLSKTNHMYSLLYLYVLRFAAAQEKIPTMTEQAEHLQLIPSDVSSAWMFWVSQGLARIDGDCVELTLASSNEDVSNFGELPEEMLAATEALPPQEDLLAGDGSELGAPENPDSEFSWFAAEVAKAFGGQVAPRDMGTVKYLYEGVGLDVFVLNMLVQHARERNKGMADIEKMALSWKEKGIDTVEKAERYVKNFKEGAKLAKEREGRRAKPKGLNNFKPREMDDREKIEIARMEELVEKARRKGVDV